MKKILQNRRLPLIAILAFSAVVYIFYGEYFSLAYLQQQREVFMAYKQANPLLSAGFYMLFYAAATAMCLPFGTVLAILAGFLFGAVWGVVIITTGATLGATAIFLISKHSLTGATPKKYNKIYNKVKVNFKENQVSYMLFLRLVPLFPFAVVNILPALFNVPTRLYVLTTFFGIIPGTFAHTYLGDAFISVTSLKGIVSPQVITAIALLGVLSLIPIFIKLYKNRKSHA